MKFNIPALALAIGVFWGGAKKQLQAASYKGGHSLKLVA